MPSASDNTARKSARNHLFPFLLQGKYLRLLQELGVPATGHSCNPLPKLIQEELRIHLPEHPAHKSSQKHMPRGEQEYEIRIQ